MIRLVAYSLMALIFVLAVLGGTVFAAPQSHYRAEPANPPPMSRLVVKETVWRCGAAGCVAPRGTSRPPIECGALAREIGVLRSFAVGGQPLDAAALGKCNARAR